MSALDDVFIFITKVNPTLFVPETTSIQKFLLWVQKEIAEPQAAPGIPSQEKTLQFSEDAKELQKDGGGDGGGGDGGNGGDGTGGVAVSTDAGIFTPTYGGGRRRRTFLQKQESQAPVELKTKDEGLAWADKHFGEWHKNLPREEFNALYAYNRMGHHLNALIRGAGESGGYKQGSTTHKHLVERIDSALSKGHMPHNVVVYRGVHYIDDPSSMVGKTFEHQGYMSTSLNRNVADYVAKKTRKTTISDAPARSLTLRLTVPKGHPGALITQRFMRGSNEVLLPRNTKVKFTKYEPASEGGIDTLHGEVTP